MDRGRRKKKEKTYSSIAYPACRGKGMGKGWARTIGEERLDTIRRVSRKDIHKGENYPQMTLAAPRRLTLMLGAGVRIYIGAREEGRGRKREREKTTKKA